MKIIRKLVYKYFKCRRNKIDIDLDVTVDYGDNVFIDANSVVGSYTFINSSTTITKSVIGKYCSIGAYVAIGQGEHPYSQLSTNAKFFESPYEEFTKKSCTIGNDVWIGSFAMINRGVSVGDGSIIGGHAVVTKDVPDYAIVAGVPAKIIGYRFSEKIIDKLKIVKWWEWDTEKINQNRELFEKDLTEEDLDLI